MIEISQALIEAQKETVKELRLKYGIKWTYSKLVNNLIKTSLTIYMFNATALLKERK